MDQQRYDEIAAQLEAGIEVELPQETWREFYAMVPRRERVKDAAHALLKEMTMENVVAMREALDGWTE